MTVKLKRVVSPETFERISRHYGHVTKDDVREICRRDRLFPLLVRCSNCRFTCAAQDVEHLVEIVEIYAENKKRRGRLNGETVYVSEDYVRDVTVPQTTCEESKPMIATPVPNAIPIDVHYATPDGVQWIELDVGANNYDGFAQSPKALDAGGRRYVRTGWNSDTGRVLYRCPGRPLAFPAY